MTDLLSPGDAPPAGPPSAPRPRVRAGEPAPPGSFDGRARAFREDRERRRAAQRERIGVFVVVVIIVIGVVTILTARPYSPTSANSFPSPGPTITVKLGTPSLENLTCGAGGTAYTEKILWENASQPVTTGDVNFRVYEIWDGDYVRVQTVVANVTASNVCAGSPPNPSTLAWYMAMSGSNGAYVLAYTATNGWVSLTTGPANTPIENGSALTFVFGVSLAGTGRGIAVVGFANGSPIRGTVPL